jgi:hypothetical protein
LSEFEQVEAEGFDLRKDRTRPRHALAGRLWQSGDQAPP